MKKDDNIRSLIEDLLDEQKKLNPQVIEDLSKNMDNDTVPTLIEALPDLDIELKIQAIRILGAIGDKRAIEPILMQFASDDTDLERAVSFTLRPEWKDASNPILIRLSKNRSLSRRLRKNVIRLLRFHESSAGLLSSIANDTSESSEIRETAVEGLGRMANESTLPLISRLLDDNKPYIRAAAVIALGRMHQLSKLSEILELFSDEHPYVRMKAIESVEILKTPDVTDELIAALSDIDTNVRVAAVKALGFLRTEEATNAIVKHFENVKHEFTATKNTLKYLREK